MISCTAFWALVRSSLRPEISSLLTSPDLSSILFSSLISSSSVDLSEFSSDDISRSEEFLSSSLDSENSSSFESLSWSFIISAFDVKELNESS